MIEKKTRRKKIKDGSVVKINLSANKLVFGRLMKSRIVIYDFIILETATVPDIETIIGKSIFLYCSIYNDVITKGLFEIIGFKELTEEEIENIPPKFTQDLVDINKCVIYYYDGREFKAKPEDCIGLESSSVWEAQGLVERIQDYYSGKRNYHVELMKPILSTNDPRYLPKPNELRWNFEKQEFYKIVQ